MGRKRKTEHQGETKNGRRGGRSTGHVTSVSLEGFVCSKETKSKKFTRVTDTLLQSRGIVPYVPEQTGQNEQ